MTEKRNLKSVETRGPEKIADAIFRKTKDSLKLGNLDLDVNKAYALVESFMSVQEFADLSNEDKEEIARLLAERIVKENGVAKGVKNKKGRVAATSVQVTNPRLRYEKIKHGLVGLSDYTKELGSNSSPLSETGRDVVFTGQPTRLDSNRTTRGKVIDLEPGEFHRTDESVINLPDQNSYENQLDIEEIGNLLIEDAKKEIQEGDHTLNQLKEYLKYTGNGSVAGFLRFLKGKNMEFSSELIKMGESKGIDRTKMIEIIQGDLPGFMQIKNKFMSEIRKATEARIAEKEEMESKRQIEQIEEEYISIVMNFVNNSLNSKKNPKGLTELVQWKEFVENFKNGNNTSEVGFVESFIDDVSRNLRLKRKKIEEMFGGNGEYKTFQDSISSRLITFLDSKIEELKKKEESKSQDKDKKTPGQDDKFVNEIYSEKDKQDWMKDYRENKIKTRKPKVEVKVTDKKKEDEVFSEKDFDAWYRDLNSKESKTKRKDYLPEDDNGNTDVQHDWIMPSDLDDDTEIEQQPESNKNLEKQKSRRERKVQMAMKQIRGGFFSRLFSFWKPKLSEEQLRSKAEIMVDEAEAAARKGKRPILDRVADKAFLNDSSRQIRKAVARGNGREDLKERVAKVSDDVESDKLVDINKKLERMLSRREKASKFLGMLKGGKEKFYQFFDDRPKLKKALAYTAVAAGAFSLGALTATVGPAVVAAGAAKGAAIGGGVAGAKRILGDFWKAFVKKEKVNENFTNLDYTLSVGKDVVKGASIGAIFGGIFGGLNALQSGPVSGVSSPLTAMQQYPGTVADNPALSGSSASTIVKPPSAVVPDLTPLQGKSSLTSSGISYPTYKPVGFEYISDRPFTDLLSSFTSYDVYGNRGSVHIIDKIFNSEVLGNLIQESASNANVPYLDGNQIYDLADKVSSKLERMPGLRKQLATILQSTDTSSVTRIFETIPDGKISPRRLARFADLLMTNAKEIGIEGLIKKIATK